MGRNRGVYHWALSMSLAEESFSGKDFSLVCEEVGHTSKVHDLKALCEASRIPHAWLIKPCVITKVRKDSNCHPLTWQVITENFNGIHS